MKTEILLRPAGLHDLDQLTPWNQCLIEDQGHRNQMPAAALRERMRGWIERGEYQAWRFEAGDKAVGYALTRFETDYVYLRQFYIDRPFRRKGLGRAALDVLCAQVRGQGKRMRVEALVNNQAGVDFWRACGFADYSLTLEKPF